MYNRLIFIFFWGFMIEQTKRQSNIELLRIFAALGVVILSYNDSSLGGGFAFVEDSSLNQFVMVVFESLFICVINVYVIISGYFNRDSVKRDVLKPIKSITMFLVFEFAAYLIKELPKGEPFSFKTLLGYFAPSYWFIFIYLALYLISPFISLMWSHMKLPAKKALLGVFITLFSVYPFVLDVISHLNKYSFWNEPSANGILQGISPISLFGAGRGYTLVNFILMYLIGCYIRDKIENGLKERPGNMIVILGVTLVLIVFWTFADKMLTGFDLPTTICWNFENPLIIIESVALFMFFNSLKIKSNKVINALAAGVYPTYLIHINLLEYLQIERFVRSGTAIMVIHMLGCMVGLFLVSFVIYTLYDLLTKPLFIGISKKWKRYRYIVAGKLNKAK